MNNRLLTLLLASFLCASNLIAQDPSPHKKDSQTSIDRMQPSEHPPTPPPAHDLPFQGSPEINTLKEAESYGHSFLTMMIALVVLLVAVYLTAWALKRLMQGKFSGKAGGKSIQILEKRALSPKTSLYLVEVEGTRSLIAESQLEIKTVSSWTRLDEDSNC